jgi:hypothetical protein
MLDRKVGATVPRRQWTVLYNSQEVKDLCSTDGGRASCLLEWGSSTRTFLALALARACACLCVLVCACACLCVLVRACACLCVLVRACACSCVFARACVCLRQACTSAQMFHSVIRNTKMFHIGDTCRPTRGMLGQHINCWLETHLRHQVLHSMFGCPSATNNLPVYIGQITVIWDHLSLVFC